MDFGTKLSIADISLTLVGFAITVWIALRAKKAAEAAEQASIAAKERILKADLHSEIATVLHLIDELKRLQISQSTAVLPERFSSLRNKVVSIRESPLSKEDGDQTALQDVVVRLSSLEKLVVQTPAALGNPKQLAKCNESLSMCSDRLLAMKERVRNS